MENGIEVSAPKAEETTLAARVERLEVQVRAQGAEIDRLWEYVESYEIAHPELNERLRAVEDLVLARPRARRRS